MMSFKGALLGASVTLVIAMGAVSANAAITTFSGQDDGASAFGPFPLSAAAQASFLSSAGAYGALKTETFESVAVGSGGGGGTFGISGGSVTTVTPYGAPYGGVNSGGSSNVYGFNTTAGGSNWLGFANGSATFNLSSPTHSFGFYTTGVQTIFTSSLTAAFSDGTSETLNLPINVSGGASYFGFTDTSAFSSVTITDISDDAWGIDDVSFNSGPTGVPEPATWAMMLVGLGGLGLVLRAHRRADRRLDALKA